jgi:hypothetical protein
MITDQTLLHALSVNGFPLAYAAEFPNKRFSGLLKIAATHAAPSPCDDGPGADPDKALVLDDSHAFFD